MIEKYLNGLEVKPDELTAPERTTLYSQGRPVDRIPCVLDTGETMAPMLGMSIDAYYHSAEMMLELELYLHDHFHSDGAGISLTLRGMAEAMGSRIRYSDHNIAVLDQPAIRVEDADQAKSVNIDEDGRLPVILEAMRLVKEKLGAEVPVSGTVTGPFTVAAMVLGTENLLIGTVRHPEKIHALMDIIVENNNKVIRRMVDMGVGIGFADPVSSTSLISKKQYETFSLPYFKKNVAYIKSLGAGCGLHICGGSRALWDDLIDSGIGTFSLDNIESMEEAKKVLGPHMCIMGNVPPIEVMRYGTPQDVLRSARDCIRQSYDSPCGYILTSGCQMPVGTPAENMTALMDAARIFGRWPVDPAVLAED